ncbi:MAG: ferrous iron transport protein B [Clostridia bacterium]|nr:ferrous iron transport protein B [Clostridia bacterium]NCC88024.1 ferrous iron transport protein B [Clostridia bacterium]
MGLTKNSVGIKAVDSGLEIKKQNINDRIVAIAGNPNVGKSTVFNNLTGLNQHTGNWPGKTVTNAQGYYSTKNKSYVMVDIPGTYSLMAHSAEEEVARNFICFGEPDAVIVVCDATCLERNLNLVLQTMEISSKVLVCVNLMDEAKLKKINIDLNGLSKKLGVPVVGTVARKKKSLSTLMDELDNLIDSNCDTNPLQVKYMKPIEDAIAIVEPEIKKTVPCKINSRWLSLKLLDYDKELIDELNAYLNHDILNEENIIAVLDQAKVLLQNNGIDSNNLKDHIVSSLILTSEEICIDTVEYDRSTYNATDRKIDKVLTSKWAGYPIMVTLLAIVFWLTITGANYPSQLLSDGLFWIQDKLTDAFHYFGAPNWLHGMLVLGVYRVLAWVVSVMLPPMAIFFPLFTLLEDAGYLPRVAYNLDKSFKRCSACGKQALTMCMGFGCNAAGIVGCRIIDSPRERLIAMITNNFVPCNGRFPTLIVIITMFFIGGSGGAFDSLLSAILLTVVILLGVFMTFFISKLLSITILKGIPSAFTLELPPYRKPQIGKVIVRSILDRTLFVLGRAIVIAAPAGLFIWVMANVNIGNTSLLNLCAGFLDPFAKLLGLDGIILMAFILGLPANEIVIPIIIMAYMAKGSILELESLATLKQLLVNNGWTWVTAISTMLFSLMHWPCSTTLLTIKKETASLKWTALSFIIPTIMGLISCFVVSAK